MTEARGDGQAGQERPNRRFPWRRAVAVTLIAALVCTGVWLRGEAKRTEFPMKEVPMPDDLAVSEGYWRCSGEAAKEATQYPRFTSARPRFGKFFAGDPTSAHKEEDGYLFALDESKGTGTGYDTLYLDSNHNLDLSDDKPVKSRAPAANVPGGGTFFAVITIPGACKDGSDLPVAPRLLDMVGEPAVSFPWGFVRQGCVRIAGRAYTATLVRHADASMRYDLPSTSIHLFAPELAIHIGLKVLWCWRTREELTDSLANMIPANGAWCGLTTTASGDTVTVHEYKGDLGVIRVSHAGKTSPNNLVIQGTLHGNGGVNISVPFSNASTPKLQSGEALLPVGNYTPDWFEVRVGRVEFVAQRLHHGRRYDEYVDSDYFLRIRKEKPCILDIQSSADILWQGAESLRAKPGDNITASLGLVTSTLMIYQLRVRPAMMPLFPAIRIQDSTGKTLNEGTGRDNYYTWTIPAKFVPRGSRETLKMTATWDTGALFGVVTGTKEIVVESTD